MPSPAVETVAVNVTGWAETAGVSDDTNVTVGGRRVTTWLIWFDVLSAKLLFALSAKNALIGWVPTEVIVYLQVADVPLNPTDPVSQTIGVPLSLNVYPPVAGPGGVPVTVSVAVRVTC